MKKVTIWTDGACSGNPGIGGWGALLCYADNKKEIFGGEQDTTNNRMEMMAAIKALECLKSSCDVTLHTDSKYLQKGMNEWLNGWIKKDWKTASNKPVKNKDLWLNLIDLKKKHNITWQWVKGHAGDPGNEEADRLARLYIEQNKNE